MLSYRYDSHSLTIVADGAGKDWVLARREAGLSDCEIESAIFQEIEVTEINDVDRLILGALTSASIVAVEPDWEARFSCDEPVHIFWDESYQILSMVDVLLEKGSVTMRAG